MIKKIMLIIATILIFTTVVIVTANLIYINEVEKKVSEKIEQLKAVGYETSFESLDASILNEKIKLNKVSIDFDYEVINIESVEVKLKENGFSELSLNSMIFPESFNILSEKDSGSVNVYFKELVDKKNESASWQIKLNTEKTFEAEVILKVNKMLEIINCIENKKCEFTFQDDKIKKELGSSRVDEFSIFFKNKGLISSLLKNTNEELINNFVKNSENVMSELKLSKENTTQIKNFLIKKDSIKILIYQKEGEDIISFIHRLRKLENSSSNTSGVLDIKSLLESFSLKVSSEE